MLNPAFHFMTIGLGIVAAWSALTIILVLPRTAPSWIPFWLVVTIGLVIVMTIAEQFRRAPYVPRHRTAAKIAVIGAGLFGLVVFLSNETIGRRAGEWDGYLTVMSGVMIVQAVLWVIVLRRTRAKTA